MGNGNRVKKRKEPRDGEINRLKAALRRMESDKRKLLSELKTLEAAFDHTVTFLRGKTNDLSVEELIQAASKGYTLIETEAKKEQSMSDLVKKWQCHKCPDGVMHLIIFANRDGQQYFRSCNKCSNRTKPKQYHDKVSGVRKDEEKGNNKQNKKQDKGIS